MRIQAAIFRTGGLTMPIRAESEEAMGPVLNVCLTQVLADGLALSQEALHQLSEGFALARSSSAADASTTVGGLTGQPMLPTAKLSPSAESPFPTEPEVAVPSLDAMPEGISCGPTYCLTGELQAWAEEQRALEAAAEKGPTRAQRVDSSATPPP